MQFEEDQKRKTKSQPAQHQNGGVSGNWTQGLRSEIDGISQGISNTGASADILSSEAAQLEMLINKVRKSTKSFCFRNNRPSKNFLGCLTQSFLKILGQNLSALAIFGHLERISPLAQMVQNWVSSKAIKIK